MKTREDAKRATQLCDEREQLINRANEIRLAHDIHFGASRKPLTGMPSFGRVAPVTLNVERLQDEFRALVTKELRAQVAMIDKALHAIGVEPDPFDAAAPIAGETAEEEGQKMPVQIVVKERRR